MVSGSSKLRGTAPRQEVVDLVDGMVGDVRPHIAPPSLWIETIELCRSDQRINGSSAFAAAVGASKQVIAAPKCHTTQCAFSRRIVDFDGTIIAVMVASRSRTWRSEARPTPVRSRVNSAEIGRGCAKTQKLEIFMGRVTIPRAGKIAWSTF